MTFPTIPTAAAGRVLTANIDGTGTRTFPDLSGLTKNSGDLLIAIIVAYQSSSGAGAPGGTVFSSWGASFTEFCDQMTTNSSTMAIGAAYKWSTGSETGTFTVTQAATITGGASLILLSIPGAHASTIPECGTIANGTTGAADPGSFNPTGWNIEDTLWISLVCSGMTSGTGSWTACGTAAPTNYTNRVDTNRADDSTIGWVEGAVAFLQVAAAAEDVGTAGVDLSNARNSACIIAVRPAANAYSVIADAGGFNLTGSDVSLLDKRLVGAGAGSYAFTGSDVTLSKVRNLSLAAEAGAFDLTGYAAGLYLSRLVTAAAGSYTLTGSTAGLNRSLVVTAGAGTYNLTGSDVTFTRTLSLTAAEGAYALTGSDVTLAVARVLTADAGSYALTGSDVTLTKAADKTLTAEAGSFTLTGADASLVRTLVLVSDSGSYALTGSDAGLYVARLATADAGAYNLTGSDVTLTYTPVAGSLTLTADPGEFTLTGADATLTYVPVTPDEVSTVQRGGSSRRKKRPRPRYWWEEEDEQETELTPEVIASLPPVIEPTIEMPSIRFRAEPEAPKPNLAPMMNAMRKRGKMKLAAMIAMQMLDD